MADADAIQTHVPSVMEDPSLLAVARVYAEAFLDAFAEEAQAGLDEFASFASDVLAANPEFESILLSPHIGRDEKLGMIERVVAPFGSETFTSFLRVLARHDRLDLLPMILQEAGIQQERRDGKQRVQVRSAVSLSEETLQSIRDQLDQTLPFEPVLVPSVDESLLGGIVIQIGDTVFDSSLRNRMQQLRTRLRSRSHHVIQSERDRFSHPEGD
ncbi:MAG: ATP synthase F1 subunit delta [Planctomycetaceae bacterium]